MPIIRPAAFDMLDTFGRQPASEWRDDRAGAGWKAGAVQVGEECGTGQRVRTVAKNARTCSMGERHGHFRPELSGIGVKGQPMRSFAVNPTISCCS